MKHIQTFESFLSENFDTDTGLAGSTSSAMGVVQGKIVISGDTVDKFQDRILDAIRKLDKTARVEYYPKTGKIVGIVTVKMLKDFQKEFRKLDGNIKSEIKK
jgi:hypothetical protein